MLDDAKCHMLGEFDHLKEDIREIKDNAKQQNEKQDAKMEVMLVSKIRTEISLENIQKQGEENKKNQESMIDALESIKNAPFKAWQQMSTAWKIGIGLAIGSQLIGSILAYIKIFIDFMSKMKG